MACKVKVYNPFLKDYQEVPAEELFKFPYPEWTAERKVGHTAAGEEFEYHVLRRKKHTERLAARLYRWVPKWLLLLWGAE